MLGGLLLGLALGSFVGVVLDRVPAHESVVFGRSRCRSCGRVLNALDLVPVLGYALRRGRCAGCGARIPVRYPLIELAAGAVTASAVAALGPLWGLLLALATIAAATSLALAWTTATGR